MLFRSMLDESMLKKGATFEDKSYVSTSTSKSVPKEFLYDTPPQGMKNVLMHIEASKGQQGLAMRNMGQPEYKYQNEILLPRGSQFKITDVKDKGDHYEVKVQLLNPKK